MLEWFGKKYDESQYYFLWKSISYFADAETDPDINGVPPYNKTWQEIKEYIGIHCTL